MTCWDHYNGNEYILSMVSETNPFSDDKNVSTY
jgi:hypothetical protein